MDDIKIELDAGTLRGANRRVGKKKTSKQKEAQGRAWIMLAATLGAGAPGSRG